jgi:hypothetical protein
MVTEDMNTIAPGVEGEHRPAPKATLDIGEVEAARRGADDALLLGKSLSGSDAAAADKRPNIDPKTEGTLAADDWHGSVRSLISACRREASTTRAHATKSTRPGLRPHTCRDIATSA